MGLKQGFIVAATDCHTPIWSNSNSEWPMHQFNKEVSILHPFKHLLGNLYCRMHDIENIAQLYAMVQSTIKVSAFWLITACHLNICQSHIYSFHTRMKYANLRVVSHGILNPTYAC